MKTILDARNRWYLAASHCHSVIDQQDTNLDYIIDVLKDHVQRYGYKMKVSYNSCCNVFTTGKFDKDHGDHSLKSKESIRYSMNLETLDRQKMIQFIVERGWTDLKGRILYPGFNMPCLPLYDIKRRLGIETGNNESGHMKEMAKIKEEEEPLTKRTEPIQMHNQESVVESGRKDKALATPMKNRFFKKEQYHNEEYVRRRNSERKEVRNENTKIIKAKWK